ncbi:hypothetical protein C5E46_35560 [Nocardia nova]|nr:hypothetical protein C5E46_35560 [Nocardia nova]
MVYRDFSRGGLFEVADLVAQRTDAAVAALFNRRNRLPRRPILPNRVADILFAPTFDRAAAIQNFPRMT